MPVDTGNYSPHPHSQHLAPVRYISQLDYFRGMLTHSIDKIPKRIISNKVSEWFCSFCNSGEGTYF